MDVAAELVEPREHPACGRARGGGSRTVLPPQPPSPREDTGVVPANLGAGAVLVDLGGVEPRALLLRRRKPPVGLWENPGGMLEEGEDFVACASRELYEETGVRARVEDPWWARVEPWRDPDDPELYAGVGFLARHPGGEIDPEAAAHDASHVGHGNRVALAAYLVYEGRVGRALEGYQGDAAIVGPENKREPGASHFE